MIWQTFLLWLLAIHSSHFFFSLSSRLSKKLKFWGLWVRDVISCHPNTWRAPPWQHPRTLLTPSFPPPTVTGTAALYSFILNRFSNIFFFVTHFFKVMSFSLYNCRKECLKEYAAVPGTSTIPSVRPTPATNCQEDFSTSPTTTVHKVENQYSTLSINNSNSNITSTSHSRLSRTSLSPTQVTKDTLILRQIFFLPITKITGLYSFDLITLTEWKDIKIFLVEIGERPQFRGWNCISLKITL